MMARLKRTAISFCAVLAVFWAYRLLAVPFIEPRIDVSKRVARVSRKQLNQARSAQTQNRLGGYARFFPPGSWELDNPIVLESDTSKVLLKEYTTLPDGRVQVTPCTVIYFPDGDADPGDIRHRVIILQNPVGAKLKFDGDIDLSRGKLSKLQGASLDGPVTIQSGATKPEGGDDLFISTHDVQMTDNLIFTPSEVDFRFGPSQGHGRNMRLELLPGPENGGKSRGPSIGGLQSFELTSDVQMHLQPGSSSFLPGDRRTATFSGPNAQQNNAVASNLRRAAQPPIDIRCQGPFQFDLVAYIATFRDQVDVLSVNPLGGRSDQMKCELLSIFFAPREDNSPPDAAKSGQAAKKSASNSNRAGMPQLEPRRMKAEGNPVVIDAPSQGLQARANTFGYKPASDGALLGDLDSDGPGWLSVAQRDDPSQKFKAHWSKKLTMLPQDQNHVISLTGNAHASYAGNGEIAAEEIHVWLYETPPNQRVGLPPRSRGRTDASGGSNNALAWISPVKMFADGGVHIESTQLSGTVKRMEAWFQDAATQSSADAMTRGNRMPAADGRQPLERVPATAQTNGNPRPHYEIKRGGLLQAWLTNGQQATLEHVELKDDVWFAESPTADDTQKPLEVLGDAVQVLRANALNTEMTVQGRPAQVGGRGLMMFGQAVHIDRGANRLWIDGAGRMTWSANPQTQNRNAPGNANSAAPGDGAPTDGPMDIDWRDRMSFDGLTALYEGDVVGHRVENRVEPDGARSQLTQTIRTAALEVTLHDRVNFAEVRAPDRSQNPAQMELMKCHGDVQLENRQLMDGHPAALDQMKLTDLVVNRITGETTSQGPGRVFSWRLGSPSAMLNPTAGAANRTPAKSGNPVAAIPVASTSANQATATKTQINYLDVQFQNGITGNVLGRRQLTFHDQVRSLYGPVPAWDARLDPDNPNGPSPQSTLLTCDQLTVNEAGPASNGIRSQLELDAAGNIRVEGRGPAGDMFTAQAAHLTYTQAKDMLVLQGDGRSDAQLFRQERPGAVSQHLRAGEIQYWPSAQRTYIPSVRSMDASQFAAPRPNPPAARPAAGTGVAR